MLLSASAAALGLGIVAYAPMDPAARSAAFLGVLLSAGSGALALVLKRLALARAGLGPVMGAMAGVFALRGILLGIGLTQTFQTAPFAFVLAFFGVYALQQTLELSWVVQTAKTFKGVAAT